MYRAPSGALRVRRRHRPVGLGPRRRQPGRQPAPTANMQQATVNLFADMGAQPATLHVRPRGRHGVDRHHAADVDASPRRRRRVADGTQVTITGTATDTAAASSPASRSRPTAARPGTRPPGTTALDLHLDRPRQPRRRRSRSRATDDSGNIETPGAGVTVNVTCPCSLWGTNVTPPTGRLGRPDAGRGRREVHVRHLRHDHRRPLLQGRREHRHAHRQPVDAPTGTRLAPATFTGETASGWQTVTFSTPGPGHAEHDLRRLLLRAQRPLLGHRRLLLPQPRARARTAARSPTARRCTPLRNTGARRPTASSPTAPSSTFPTNSFGAANYWVDVIFTPTPAPGTVTGVTRRRRRHDVGERDLDGARDRRRRRRRTRSRRTSARPRRRRRRSPARRRDATRRSPG